MANKIRVTWTHMDPYEIHVDNSEFTLVERTGKKNAKGEDQFVFIGHYQDMTNALKEVVRMKMLEKHNKQTMELREFIDEYRRMHQFFVDNLKLTVR